MLEDSTFFIFMIASSNTSKKQQTINSSISLSGIGLHSGKKVAINIEPAEINNGIKFIRTGQMLLQRTYVQLLQIKKDLQYLL